MRDSEVKIGFAAGDLSPALPAELPVNEGVDVRCFALRQGRRAALWAVFDLMDLDLPTVERLRSAINGVAPRSAGSHLHILSTHNHGAPEPERRGLSRIAAIAADTAKQAFAAARPARMRGVVVDLPEPLSIQRRIRVPEVKGAATLFYGVGKHNDFDASGFVRKYLSVLKESGELCFTGESPGASSPRPVPPGPSEAALLEFIDAADSHPLGSIVRFSAHAVCSNLPGCISSDYPGYLRREIESSFGGTAIFLNGPCGEIAPAIPGKSRAAAAAMGKAIASGVLNAIAAEPFEQLRFFLDRSRKLKLPLRPELRMPGMEQSTSPLPTAPVSRRREVERRNLFLDFLGAKLSLPEGDQRDPDFAVELGALRLNRWLIAAYPGETFASTAAALHRSRREISVTEHGRTAMYIPPSGEYRRGGYEVMCAAVPAGGEAVLRDKAGNFFAETRKKRFFLYKVGK